MPLVELNRLIADHSARLDGANARPVATGLTDLDRIHGGLPIGLTVIAGLRGMGCSSLATQIALHAATTMRPRSVAVFAVAGGPGEFFSHLSAGLRNSERASREQRLWPHALSHALAIPNDRVWIDTCVALSVDEVAHRARKWSSSTPGAERLILVDGLHALADVEINRKRGAAAAGRLHDLAIALGVPVLLSARLPDRSAQDDSVPKLSELRAYGPILEHCDTVILIHRDDYYNSCSERPGEADLHVWSNQSGTHEVVLTWNYDRLRFLDYAAAWTNRTVDCLKRDTR
jgi:replicative DNA helicase